MARLFDRFKKRRVESSTTKGRKRLIDKPLIGSELFPDSPQTARELVMPARRALQTRYTSEGRAPESLSKIPSSQRDESFWMAYIDSLMVFERDDEALVYATDAVARFPNNPLLREMKASIERRMRTTDG